MIETYEYILKSQENESYNIKCKIEYDTNNSYNTNYYFYDGNKWLKDFIDLEKLSPETEESKEEFEDFVTNVHDYMVHGTLWQDLEKIEDGQTVSKDQYKVNIISKKI